MTYHFHWFNEQVGLAGDLGSTNDVLIPLYRKGIFDREGRGSGNSVKEKGLPMDDGLDVGNGGEASGFVTSNIRNSPSPPGNVPNSISFATKVKRNTSQKTVNFRTLLMPAGNGMDVHVQKEIVSVVNERLNNTVYGFFLEGIEAMLESSPWLICNVPLVLKKWTPNVNIMKDDVCNIHVWVKFHDVPITAFTEYVLSAIATKLDSPLMLDSYMAAMCIDSWGRASYARSMIELKPYVDLRTNAGWEFFLLVDEHGKLLEMKVMNEASASKPSTYMRDQLVESDEDEVELPDDETSRYMSSTGRGGLCEDDLDFYDGYEARVYDLPDRCRLFVINLISAFVVVLRSNFASLRLVHKIGMSLL
ncbi:zinc knuckle CX2CX4HX4C containing protein [Tanacetum coccineum]